MLRGQHSGDACVHQCIVILRFAIERLGNGMEYFADTIWYRPN